MENPNLEYRIKTEQYDLSYEQYIDFDRSFGHFSQDGSAYYVTDRNTPRQWLNFMVNDWFVSAAGNDGSGFTSYDRIHQRITRFCCESDYMVRTLDSRRILKLQQGEKSYDLLRDSKDLVFKVTPGASCYEGSVADVRFRLTLFVPNQDPCECWLLELFGSGTWQFTAAQELSFSNARGSRDYLNRPDENMELTLNPSRIDAASYREYFKKKLYALFSMVDGQPAVEKIPGTVYGNSVQYPQVSLTKKVQLQPEGSTFWVISGASDEPALLDALHAKYTALDVVTSELTAVAQKWHKIIDANTCSLPDKNMEHFLNYWLKNQVYLTMRYNRTSFVGYRDLVQDLWGHLLVKPDDVKPYLLLATTHIYENGNCLFQFERSAPFRNTTDYMDSPLWLPLAVCDYIRETGDFDFLNETVSYLDSDATIVPALHSCSVRMPAGT